MQAVSFLTLTAPQFIAVHSPGGADQPNKAVQDGLGVDILHLRSRDVFCIDKYRGSNELLGVMETLGIISDIAEDTED